MKKFTNARICRMHDETSEILVDQGLASIRHGEYPFKRPEPSYEVELDLFTETT